VQCNGPRGWLRQELFDVRLCGPSSFFGLYHNDSSNLFGPSRLDDQSLTAAPLALGEAIPTSALPSIVGALNTSIADFDFHLTYGFVGAKHVLHQLSSYGLHETAMRIATRRDYPSFGHWLALGATTCWENWSGFADITHPPEPTYADSTFLVHSELTRILTGTTTYFYAQGPTNGCIRM